MVVSARQLGPAYLAFVLPLPFILYFTFKVALGSIEDHVRHVAALDTERTRAEGARRQSEAMFETLAETMSVGVFIAQGDRLRYVNTAAERMTGFDRLELKSMPWYDVGDADSRALMQSHAEAVEPGGAAPKRCDVGFLTKSGAHRWVEMSWAAIPFEGERAVLAVAVDITERTEARRALEQVTEVYRSLIQGAVFGIYRAALDGLFLDVNPALVTMLGYSSSDELIEASAAGLIYADAAQKTKLQHVYHTTGRIQNVEVQWKRRDGQAITARLSGRAVMDGNGAVIGFEVIAEDVTQRRELEEQLRQAQKMEAVGRLAGGVAHDFNNLLTAIIGYSHLLTVELGDAPTAAHVEEITSAATRAADLTGQLLTFSRKQVLNPTVLDLRSQITQLEKMLRRLIGADIDLQIALPPELWRVHGDAGQIDQVLLNLAVNARDAMPRGGRLTVEVGNRELDAAEARRLGVPAPGQYVVLSVADTGSGIDAATLPHIFEPFFTTKETGRGTGLGLATVYGVVTQSGGHVHVASQLQLGTTFSIYLPAVQGAADPVPLVETQLPSPPGTETVLLVEDEPGVRRLAIRVLEKQGYQVLSADNATAALGVARGTDPIDLLITDIVMPGQSGPDLAAELVAERPGLKILFMSGYSESRLRDANRCAAGAFLQKPFTPSVLAQRVRECLDRPLAV
jgi:PAS domain S-box-containing protein